jgi:hypothetical protein
MNQPVLLHTPPSFCQYAEGPCDQSFAEIERRQALFLFSNAPGSIAGAIEAAASHLNEGQDERWDTWKHLDIGGRIIFCEICKAIRGADTVFADVTTLNFNLLFELGFCLGLNIPVIPIRDPSYSPDEKAFRTLGVLDTLGYVEFANATGLAHAVQDKVGRPPLGRPPKKTFRDAPLYVLKGPIDTEGVVRLMSTLETSALKFRSHDPDEQPRLSLHAHWKQVQGSYGVFAHLLSDNRPDHLAHNALCALLCGIALAEQKAVLMVQEEGGSQPIDYRDLVQTYDRPDQVPRLLEQPIATVFERMQEDGSGFEPPPIDLLSRIDLGAPAAENEVAGLGDYYVHAAPFNKALQGHSRLVVGRKGAGKTALFYAIRSAASRGHETLILDLKPQGHQFTRLREAVVAELSPGQQEHTIEAFWTFLLAAEVANKILNNPRELKTAEREPRQFERYEALQHAYFEHGLASAEDFSQRLLRQVDRLAKRFSEIDDVTVRTDLPELLFGGDLRSLVDAVAEYVAAEQPEVWLLMDNLDKGWPTRGASREDIIILGGLLDAARSLERQLERRGVNFRCLIFIRTDILERLDRFSSDRGKESLVALDGDDVEVFREILRKRICASTELDGDFASVWSQVAAPTVGTRDSFGYMAERTLMRPRDMLVFVEQALEVATNRGHTKIDADDIRHAEVAYSETALLFLGYEIEDTAPALAESIYSFHSAPRQMKRKEVEDRLGAAGVPEEEVGSGLELLLWFGFLGIKRRIGGDEEFAYQAQFNLRKLLHQVSSGDAVFVVHPGFRVALAIESAE